MKTNIYFLLLFFFPCLALSQVSQEWVQRYNGPENHSDYGNSVVVDASGNVYVTGNSYNAVGINSDYATVKYNSSGAQQWAVRYNGPGNQDDKSVSIAVDASGNVYVTGSSFGSGTNRDYATIKYNSSGVEQWVQRYNGSGNGHDEAVSIKVDASGNVYVTGYSNEGGTGSDYTTIKYNSSGSQQWIQSYHYNTTDIANSLAIDASGNVYVTGSSLGTGIDFATIKYNSSGVQQWAQRYNGPGNGNDIGYSIGVDASGNVYVTGYSTGSGTARDITTIKYNPSGSQQWVQSYNGTGNQDDNGYSLAVDPSGNVYVTGSTFSTGTGVNYATIKYNSSGAQQWAKTFNGSAGTTDIAHSIAIDLSGNAYVTGYVTNNETGFDYTTVKYSSSGAQMWVQSYHAYYTDIANSVAVDASGNVYVTGHSSNSSVTSFDYVTIKYSQSQVFTGEFRKNALGKAIMDMQSTYDTIDIDYSSAANYYVLDVNLKIDTVIHTNVSDLEFYFIHNGITDTVIYQAGGSGDNFIGTLLNDSAATIISSGTAPFTGSYRPHKPLSQFNNGDINGTWILKIFDRATGNTGTLQAWSLIFTIYNNPIGITPIGNIIPDGFSLSQNYPNPFNPSTKIKFDVPKSSFVKLAVYDILGKKVSSLVYNELKAGTYEYTFDAAEYNSGVYFYKLETDGFSETKKMLLVK